MREADMETVRIKDEYIKLGQAMKLSGIAQSGVDAKELIQEGLVTVNGETEVRRGRKLYPGDTFSYDGESVEIKR